MHEDYPMRRAKGHIQGILKHRDIVTLSEIVNICLLELVEVEPVEREGELIEHIPQDVHVALQEKLVDIRNDDYQWRPPLIGGTPPMASVERLRHLDKLFNAGN